MAGQLDSLFKTAKQIVSDLGSFFDSSIAYKKSIGSYNTSTGVFTTTDTNYSINAPLNINQLKTKEKQDRQKFI